MKVGPLGLVPPGRLRSVVGPLGENDVVVSNDLLNQALRVRCDLPIACNRNRGRECGNDVGVAAFEVPEVVEVAVREDDKAAVLGAGIPPGLLLAGQRVLILGLGLQDNQRGSPVVE